MYGTRHWLGKTLPTLMRILELYQQKEIATCLVVCPKAVIGSWHRDIEKFTPKEQMWLKRITIINYDKVWRGKEFLKQWDCIVLDEAHAIKSRTSKRASFLINLSLSASYRYLLTGTPISNACLEDMWSLMTFLKPYKSGRSICSSIFREKDGGRGTYYEWLNRYAYLDQYHKPYKYRHVSELQAVLSEYSYRVTKAQCLDLPEKLPDDIMEMELIDAKKIYKDIAKNSASLELGFVADNPLVRLTKLRQLASGFFIQEDGETRFFKCEKDTALAEFLDSYDGKVVIFAEFKASIQKLTALLHQKKLKHVVLDGAQKDKTIWRQFQEDESVRAIICQYQTASAGVDLFASSMMIFYEPTLRSNILLQAESRIHRNGQKIPCSYIHFLTSGTVEMAIYKALKGYSDFSEKLFIQYIEEYQRRKR